ncbi:unnamed protein product [Thelazia callipaeda]|uniref:Uncharacterized protein n=1 Tax=Thelazia callipaeda TaxID=103827 RepID=A0A0N5CWP4_THECL|nr:unnamed protein product [Thelazia callipaeda]
MTESAWSITGQVKPALMIHIWAHAFIGKIIFLDDEEGESSLIKYGWLSCLYSFYLRDEPYWKQKIRCGGKSICHEYGAGHPKKVDTFRVIPGC